MIEVLGTALLWVVAVVMIVLAVLFWIGEQLARSKGAGPSVHSLRRGSTIMGLSGVAMLVLLLTGCASAPPVRDRIVEVVKPVAVQPITAAQVPVLPAPLSPRPQGLRAASDILLAKVCEWVGYGLRSDPLLKVSAGEKPVEAQLYPECERR